MSHRIKNRHKPRHHTHTQKPANLPKPELPPVALEAPVLAPDRQFPTETEALSQTPPSSL